jgi:NAD(P)-dependent dehydrogenase (short-subunit alcohol dehydrogenase family)
MKDLQGRVAVVTGGGSGMGRGMCLAFAAEGMDVVVADIEVAAADRVAAEVRSVGRRALPLRVDVSDRDAVEALAARATAEFGRVDVLCNNAGVYVAGLLQDMAYADWDWVMGVNVDGVVNGVQAFLPGMLARGEGHIVNTASMAGLIPSARGLGLYTATKYAVVGLSECLLVDLKGTGVGVSVLCPGSVNTAIATAERNRPSALARETPLNPAYADEIVPRLQAGKDPDDVGRLVARAVREDWFYILTDTGMWGLVERRFGRIRAAFEVQAAVG